MAATQPADLTYTPQSEGQITNIDVLRQWISNYYGDPGKTGVFADDSNYAREARNAAADGEHWLAAKAKSPKPKSQKPSSAQKAIVMDVDDTTLATWNYEIFSNWAYNPTTNARYVLGQMFPAVPGMVEMATKAAQDGYAIIFLTGRGSNQEAATLGNLTSDGVGVDAGYPDSTTLSNGEDRLFTKPPVASYPVYLQQACAVEIAAGKSCTTIHYKSARSGLRWLPLIEHRGQSMGSSWHPHRAQEVVGVPYGSFTPTPGCSAAFRGVLSSAPEKNR